MKTQKIIVRCVGEPQYKCTSIYGNPSYWGYFEDIETGKYISGYTGSNYTCGYSIQNIKPGDIAHMIFHYTRTGSVVITDLRKKEL